MNTSHSQLYDDCLNTIKSAFLSARRLNRDAHADLLKEAQSMLNKEIADFTEYHSISPDYES